MNEREIPNRDDPSIIVPEKGPSHVPSGIDSDTNPCDPKSIKYIC